MLHGCQTGDAKITQGYRLPARHVIHTVGPVWNGGALGEDDLLASCYRRSIELCEMHGLASVAFPAISTGIYRFPAERAAGIAVATVADSAAIGALGDPRCLLLLLPGQRPVARRGRGGPWPPLRRLTRTATLPGEFRGGVQ